MEEDTEEIVRREKSAFSLELKVCQTRPVTSSLSPQKPTADSHNVRRRGKFKSNDERTEQYRRSTTSHNQRKLNDHYNKLEKLENLSHLSSETYPLSLKSLWYLEHIRVATPRPNFKIRT